jgi:hypothetical protein
LGVDKYTKISRETFAFIIVGIDILGIIILLASFIFIKISQNTTEKIFKEEIIQISDFTLHFSNLEFKADKIYEEFENIYCHLNEVYKVEIKNRMRKIYETDKSISLSTTKTIEGNKTLLELERLENLRKNNNNIFYDINFTFVDMNRIDIIIQKNKLVTNRKKLEFERNYNECITENRKYKLDQEINQIKSEEEKLLEDYLKFKENSQKIDDVYITFKNTEEVELIKNAYKKGIFTRCCIIICCNKKSIKHL